MGRYLVFGVANLEGVLSADLRDQLHGGRDDVEDSEGGDGSEETGHVDVGGAPEMELAEPELVSLVDHQVGLEGHVERNEDSEVAQSCKVAQLEGAYPLEDSGVLVDDFTLLEVEGLAGELGGHLDEGLIEIGGVVDVLFELEEAIDGSTEELRMAETISHIFVLLLGPNSYVVLVALAVVIVAGDGAVEPLPLPLDDVLELRPLVPGSVGDEAILVLEGPANLLGDLATGEAQVGEVGSGGAVGVEVGIDAGNASLVGAVEIGDGVPDLPLDGEIVLELIDDPVVLLDFGLVVVLVELGGDVFGRVGVLVGQGGVGFVVDEDVVLEQLGVGLLFGGVEQAERVVLVGTEASHGGEDLAGQHPNDQR